ncbi:MAG: serine/threonine protein kinase [Myxococcota bacterium]
MVSSNTVQSPSVPPRIPSWLGPYRVERIIGQGGMGVVLLARHLSYNTPVAIKTPVVSIHEPHALTCLSQEIQLLRRLTHPGIVKLLEHGYHEGLPYMVMPFLPGMTLGSLLPRHDSKDEQTRTFSSRAPEWSASLEQWVLPPVGPDDARMADSADIPRSGGLPIQQVLDLMRALCEPLAYLHQEGIVHRDLKPDNIMLGANGLPVLFDLGLSISLFDHHRREVLALRGGAQGTAAYTAPEQWRGQRPDPRSDLYALGCIMYRALTGRTPFEGDLPEQLMRAHLREPVVAPSRWNPQLSPGVDALVLRLLAKHPQDRFEYAIDVADALERLGARPPLAWQDKLPETFPYLHSAPFRGMEEGRQLLRRALLRVQQDRGGILSVLGVAGAGKTRLLNECLTRAQAGAAEVVVSQCRGRNRYTWSGPGGLQPFLPFLATLVHHHVTGGTSWTQGLLEPEDAPLCALEPRLALLLGLSKPPQVAPDSPMLWVERMLSLLQRVARRCPLVLVLDEVDQADGLTLLLLDKLRQRSLESLPLLVVLSARSECLTPELERLLCDGRNDCVELGRLFSDEASLTDLLRTQLPGLEPSPELLDWLLRQTAGNPYFLSECLRWAQDLGWIERHAPGEWRLTRLPKRKRSVPELPTSLRKLLEARLSLNRSSLWLLRRVLLMGPDYAAGVLLPSRAVEQEEQGEQGKQGKQGELLDILRQMFSLQVLEMTDDGRLKLTHEALRAPLGLPGEPTARFRVSGGVLTLSSLRHGYFMSDAPSQAVWTLDGTTRRAPRSPPLMVSPNA